MWHLLLNYFCSFGPDFRLLLNVPGSLLLVHMLSVLLRRQVRLCEVLGCCPSHTHPWVRTCTPLIHTLTRTMYSSGDRSGSRGAALSVPTTHTQLTSMCYYVPATASGT